MKDKRGRRLTRRQKETLERQPRQLNTENWLCISDDGIGFEIRHKVSGRIAYVRYA